MTLETAEPSGRSAAAKAPAPASARPAPRPRAGNARAWWLRQLRTWHWISSAVCLVGLLLFTITGITLNHAGQIEAEPRIESLEFTLPDALIQSLAEGPEEGAARLPAEAAAWLAEETGAPVRGAEGDWDAYEVYFAFPRPGGDAWLAIDRETGETIYESTGRGAVAYLNDLHKGRNTSLGWIVFIDVFAVASLAFCLTGLALLYLYSKGRRSTWPLVGAGLAIPLLIALFLIH